MRTDMRKHTRVTLFSSRIAALAALTVTVAGVLPSTAWGQSTTPGPQCAEATRALATAVPLRDEVEQRRDNLRNSVEFYKQEQLDLDKILGPMALTTTLPGAIQAYFQVRKAFLVEQIEKAYVEDRLLSDRLQPLNNRVLELEARRDAACGRPPEPPKPATDGLLIGDCKGTIKAVPDRGAPGMILNVNITIEPPFDELISRVATDNPACREDPACDARRIAPGRFTASLRFQSPRTDTTIPISPGVLGTFKVKFAAYDEEKRLRCRGESIDLTVTTP
jgi:hypothetical protein